MELTEQHKKLHRLIMYIAYNKYANGGPLHITVCDGNMEDHHLLFCLVEYIKQTYEEDALSEEVELIQALMDMPLEERDKLWEAHYDWKDDKD